MADYFDKLLEERGEKEIKDYPVCMLETRKLSRGTYRGYVAGIKFLYKTTLNREELVEKIHYPKAKNTAHSAGSFRNQGDAVCHGKS